MKKLAAFILIVASLFLIQLLTTCSKPLKSLDGYDQNPPLDTLVIVDTISSVDTVIIVDTVVMVDTIIIEIPDSGGTDLLCGRLNSSRQEIVWMFRNQQRVYRLELLAILERDNPPRTLLVDIEGQQFYWDVTDNHQMIIEGLLPQNATMIISTLQPRALGQAIDICLFVDIP